MYEHTAGAEPNATFAIGTNRPNEIRCDPLGGAIQLRTIVTPADESGSGANPKAVFSIFAKLFRGRMRQQLIRCKAQQRVVFISKRSAKSANPDCSILCFVDIEDRGQFWQRVGQEVGDFPLLQAKDLASVSANP